ncbi:MAG: cytidine deaminase [Firmicutes bacterium]|nr:cytidine deaminase [Bacillota bacterium]
MGGLEPAAAARQALIAAAAAVREHAYAPYSGFRVGAAVLAEGGAVAAGANVENASYPVGICAEQAAVAAAVAAGHRRLQALAVVSGEDPPAAPCGACRQMLAEFGDPRIYLAVAGETEPREAYWLHELLPRAFGPADLERKR